MICRKLFYMKNHWFNKLGNIFYILIMSLYMHKKECNGTRVRLRFTCFSATNPSHKLIVASLWTCVYIGNTYTI